MKKLLLKSTVLLLCAYNLAQSQLIYAAEYSQSSTQLAEPLSCPPGPSQESDSAPAAPVQPVSSMWTFSEWEPRYSSGIAGYQGGRASDGSAFLKNVGEIGRAAWYSTQLPVQQWSIYDLILPISASGLSYGRISVNLYDADGKDLGERGFTVERGTYPFQRRVFSFITPAGTKSARIYVTSMGRGTVSFGEPTLKRVDAATRTTMLRGDTRYLYTPRETVRDAALSDCLSSSYQSTGYIHYRRSDPRFTYPESIPQESEVINTLTASVAPGQHAGLWFTTHALRSLDNVQVTLNGDLVNAAGHVIPRSQVTLKLIRFWLQRTTWATTNYYSIPELLEDLDDLEESIRIPSGNNQGFWVHVKVPPNTFAGRYHANLTFSANGVPATTLALDLEVYPFRLESPPAVEWAMYSDLGRQIPKGKHTGGAYTEDELNRYLLDMKEYGITSLVDTAYGRNAQGELSFDLTSRIASQFKRAGMPGSLTLSAGLQYMTYEAMKLNFPNWKWMTYHPSLEDPQFEAEYRARLSTMDSIIRNAGVHSWYYYLTDEPSEPEKLKLAIWEGQNAQAAGVKTAATLYPYEKLSQLIPYLDVNLNSFQAKTAGDTSRYWNLVRNQHDAKLWYLGAGSYTDQEGGLMPNRYQAGFLFYKSRSTTHVSWTYQRREASPFDDFDGDGIQPKDAAITYPARNITADKVTLPTLQWEGIREGIDDYKYIVTLKRWIDRARAAGHTAAADRASDRLNGLITSMPHVSEWSVGESYGRPGTFTNADATWMRRQLANEIMTLKALMPDVVP